MEKISIRAAQKGDEGIILSFIQALAEFEKLSHEVVATEQSLGETLFGPKSVAKVLLAYLGEGPVGFALYFYSYSTFLAKPGLYLEDLFVLPELRSHGVGKKLLQELARTALKEGLGRMEWSCLDWNERALKFYASLGAVPMKEWTVQRLKGKNIEALAHD